MRRLLPAAVLLASVSLAAAAPQDPAGAAPKAEAAKPAKAAPKAPARKPGKPEVFRGFVASVDPAAKKLVVKDSVTDAAREFVVGDKALLTKSVGEIRKKLTLAQIKPGDAVLVFFDADTVEKIHVVSVKPKAAPAKAAAAGAESKKEAPKKDAPPAKP